MKLTFFRLLSKCNNQITIIQGCAYVILQSWDPMDRKEVMKRCDPHNYCMHLLEDGLVKLRGNQNICRELILPIPYKPEMHPQVLVP